MAQKTIWLYGESMVHDTPGDRVAFDSKEAAERHARQRAEAYAEEKDEDPPVRNEYDSWFGYATDARSFQVWPIPYHQSISD